MTRNIKNFRYVVVASALCGIFYACGTAPAEPVKPISVNVNPQIPSRPEIQITSSVDASPEDSKALIEKGKTAIAGSDCFACHQEKDKLVGPSYADVAKKYTESDIPYLIKKIIDGGAGVWGEIPMAPHSGLHVSDAEAMVRYILSVN